MGNFLQHSIYIFLDIFFLFLFRDDLARVMLFPEEDFFFQRDMTRKMMWGEGKTLFNEIF
jgi:hypothetical protein